jgi:hypothetical protein
MYVSETDIESGIQVQSVNSSTNITLMKAVIGTVSSEAPMFLGRIPNNFPSACYPAFF